MLIVGYSPVGGVLILVEENEEPGFSLAPVDFIPGYTSDGTNIIIPISSLLGLDSVESDEITGDWRKIFQSLLLLLHSGIQEIPVSERPKTVDVFMLDNWNAKSAMFEYGYGNKRTFQVSFNIKYAFQQIRDEV